MRRRWEGEAGLEETFSSLAFITGRLCNEERGAKQSCSARGPPGRSWSTPHVCLIGQALGTALIQTQRGWRGPALHPASCSPVWVADGILSGLQLCSAFLTPLQDTLAPDGMKTLAWVSLLLSAGGTAEPYVEIPG